MTRILTIADAQGNLDVFSELYYAEHAKGKPVDFIIHTGNFGFWDERTLEEESAYLKQIVAFSEALEPELARSLNDLSLIEKREKSDKNDSIHEEIDDELSINLSQIDNELSAFNKESKDTYDDHSDFTQFNSFCSKDAFSLQLRQMLKSSPLSQFSEYLSRRKSFPCPVYTVFGPLDDPRIVDMIQKGALVIPNLFLIDHTKVHTVNTPEEQPDIRLYGLGGSMSIQSLFDNASSPYSGLSGRPGDLWITLTQIAEMYSHIASEATESSINLFVCHSPVIKSPVLEHLAIITKADFTISSGLHFRYPVMGNGMSFVDSMGGSSGYVESYKFKFSRLRMILGELWRAVRGEIENLLKDKGKEQRRNDLINALELGLSLFDKIPVIQTDFVDKIVPLTLFEPSTESETSRAMLKRINDYYFQAYFNLWHFNLCDCSGTEKNIMIFRLDDSGNFKLDHATSQGFNFGFKKDSEEYDEYNGDAEDDEDSDAKKRARGKNARKPTRGKRGSFRSRGPGRGKGEGRGRGSIKGKPSSRGRGRA